MTNVSYYIKKLKKRVGEIRTIQMDLLQYWCNTVENEDKKGMKRYEAGAEKTGGGFCETHGKSS